VTKSKESVKSPDRKSVILLGNDATETAFKEGTARSVSHLASGCSRVRRHPVSRAISSGPGKRPRIWRRRFAASTGDHKVAAECRTDHPSACDTGVGKLQGQEGISNLVEAFLVAGSQSVVASLWSADDTFASALMERFYQRMAQGEDTSSALRNAKLDLLAKYGDQVRPFYWAAFIAVERLPHRLVWDNNESNLDERTKILERSADWWRASIQSCHEWSDWKSLVQSRREQILRAPNQRRLRRKSTGWWQTLRPATPDFDTPACGTYPLGTRSMQPCSGSLSMAANGRCFCEDVHQGGAAYSAGIALATCCLDAASEYSADIR